MKLPYRFQLKLALVLIAGLTLAACDNDATPTIPGPGPTTTETFTGAVSRNGSQTHAFVATAAGAVTATITAIEPAGSPLIGFALGNFDPLAGVCTAVVSNNNATASSVLSGNVVGISSLCVRLFDAFGNVPADVPVNYTVSVVRPGE